MAQAIEAQRALERAAEEETREQVREEEAPAPLEAPDAIGQGARVRHVKLGSEGLVLEVSGRHATVQLGALRSKVPLDDLLLVTGPKKPLAQPGFRKSKAEKLGRGEAARAAAVEIRAPLVDVRGQRVDEALRSLELELDRHLRAGEESVQVLHGHGTGALKAAVREHLSRSPYVLKARSAESHEGGDGVTVVTLRG